MKKIITITSFISMKLLIAFGFFLLIFCLFVSKILAKLFQAIERILESICIKYNLIHFVSTPESENIQGFEPTFTGGEIDVMARKAPKNLQTIQDVKEHFKISYRQARKVKDAIFTLQNAPDIHSIYA